MSGLEIGCILLAIGLYLVWLCTPGKPAQDIMDQQKKDARDFRDAMRKKVLEKEKSNG